MESVSTTFEIYTEPPEFIVGKSIENFQTQVAVDSPFGSKWRGSLTRIAQSEYDTYFTTDEGSDPVDVSEGSTFAGTNRTAVYHEASLNWL